MPPLLVILVLVASSAALIFYALLPRKTGEKKHVVARLVGDTGALEASASASGSARPAAGMREMIDKIAPYAMKPRGRRSVNVMSNK